MHSTRRPVGLKVDFCIRSDDDIICFDKLKVKRLESFWLITCRVICDSDNCGNQSKNRLLVSEFSSCHTCFSPDVVKREFLLSSSSTSEVSTNAYLLLLAGNVITSIFCKSHGSHLLGNWFYPKCSRVDNTRRILNQRTHHLFLLSSFVNRWEPCGQTDWPLAFKK